MSTTAALRMVRPLGKRGQVVIPRDVRHYLGLREGGEVAFEIHDRRVEIRAADNRAFLAEFLNVPRLKGPSPSPQALKSEMCDEHS